MAKSGPVLTLAAGAIGVGLLGVLKPARLAALIGASEQEARAIGLRDLGNGAALLASRDPRAALVARASFDLSDAVRYGARRPKVLLAALAFFALALYAYWRELERA